MFRSIFKAAIGLSIFAFVGCATTPPTQEAKSSLQDESSVALRRFERADAGLADFLNRAYGYAIFPSIGKGGAVVGGAYGQGALYEQGRLAGYTDVTQASIGAQLGGATFAELIVFENADAAARFKRNEFSAGVNASAVAIKTGASATTRFENGIAIFTMPNGGLMAEATIAGQRFTYQPVGSDNVAAPRSDTRTQTQTETETQTNRPHHTESSVDVQTHTNPNNKTNVDVNTNR